jgi:hypothetical protein
MSRFNGCKCGLAIALFQLPWRLNAQASARAAQREKGTGRLMPVPSNAVQQLDCFGGQLSMRPHCGYVCDC